ncbi:hypothetical protein ACJX0J_038416 [Zea mays]
MFDWMAKKSVSLFALIIHANILNVILSILIGDDINERFLSTEEEEEDYVEIDEDIDFDPDEEEELDEDSSSDSEFVMPIVDLGLGVRKAVFGVYNPFILFISLFSTPSFNLNEILCLSKPTHVLHMEYSILSQATIEHIFCCISGNTSEYISTEAQVLSHDFQFFMFFYLVLIPIIYKDAYWPVYQSAIKRTVAYERQNYRSHWWWCQEQPQEHASYWS